MRKEQRLRTSSEFALVRQRGRWWANPLLTLRALPNQQETTRFGFLVTRRVGKAVVRNRTKRRLREIARKEPVRAGWDLVLIAKPAIAETSFAEVRRAVQDLLRQGHLYPSRPGPGDV